MAKSPKKHRMPWTAEDDRTMKRLVKERLSAADIAKELGRSAAAVQQRLMLSGISLRAARKAKPATRRSA